MFEVLFLILLSTVALFWLWLNLEPKRQRNGNYRLEPPADGCLPDADALPKVAILCPGRDEGHWIKETLPELCAQENVRYRVVYIDDQSDDDTPATTARCAAEHPHLLVVRNEQAPPPGWVGKPWAVRQGYEALCEAERLENGEPAEWVCFTDADIHWHPQCLATALCHAKAHDADLVAIFPGMEFGSTAERIGVSTMIMALGIVFPFEKTMDPRSPKSLTGGAFMLVRREIYDQIGGHHSVSNRMVEDVNLGMNLKAAGARLRVAATRELMYCRMYEGWSDLWEGLTKNAYAGMDYRPHYAAITVTVAILANVLPPVYLAGSLIWLALGGGAMAAAASALSAAILLLQARMTRWVRALTGLPWRYTWLTPLGSAVYTMFILGSVWRYYRGGNVWKGRSYDAAALTSDAP